VLIIDEAQNLSREVLEQIRLLTNLETTKQKLLQIILIGQPELSNLLAQRDLRQLSQRITARCHLEALTRKETFEYIFHRCRVAGAKSLLFNRTAMERVFSLSGGIPRLINIICDRALLGCYVRNKTVVDPAVVRHAAAEIGIGKLSGMRFLFRALVPASAAVLLLIVAGWQMPALFNFISPGDKVAIALASPQLARMESSLPAPEDTAASNPKSNLGAFTVTSQLDQNTEVPNKTTEPSLEMKFVDPAAATDTVSAMKRLFDHWGLDYTALAGTTGCERALHAGLHCLYQTGTWNNLRTYNRPAVIELRDTAGQNHHVLVASLTGDTVLLEMGNYRQEVAISEVERLWFGKYLFLWKPRAPEQEILRLGDRRESVVWLRDSLARYRREPIPADPSNLFDEELEYQLKDFQSYHRLAEDGIAGRVTIEKLRGYLPEKSPLLNTESVLVKVR
jgi:general secretion pathway protein A